MFASQNNLEVNVGLWFFGRLSQFKCFGLIGNHRGRQSIHPHVLYRTIIKQAHTFFLPLRRGSSYVAACPPKSRRPRHANAWAWHCCPCVAHKRTPQRTKCLIDFQLHGLSCWRVFSFQLGTTSAPQVQSGQTIDAGGLQISASPTFQTTTSPIYQ